MSSTLISFDGDYYKYHGGREGKKGLAIGGYKSSFLSDLVAYYLFSKANNNFLRKMWHDIYEDDGLVLFKGKKSVYKIRYWLEYFQNMVNKSADNQRVQFTTKIWTSDKSLLPFEKKEKFQISAADELPLLDMNMIWSPEGGMRFLIFRKRRQQLKLVGNKITNTPVILHTIQPWFLNHLAKLIFQTTEYQPKRIDYIYIHHANYLCEAGLAPSDFPTMG